MNRMPYDEAVGILIENVQPAGVKTVGIEKLYGRIPACDIVSKEDVPSFARSPYDGYAFRSCDTACIGTVSDHVTLKVIEDIRAGETPRSEVIPLTAVRLMTGAPIPKGADCVCKFEDTDRTGDEVVIKRSYRSRENVVEPGEDIRKGSIVVRAGSVIDPGTLGVMASLGITEAKVYKRIKAGIITTGDEVADINGTPAFGMIRDSNRYMIASALKGYDVRSVFLGHASDDEKSIGKLIGEGIDKCDLIISTGGVSVGDYDLVPKVMADMGFDILVNGTLIKPGMASVYGVKDKKMMLALSGNPASALTNLHCVCGPAIRKMKGLEHYEHEIIDMKMIRGFANKSDNLRLVRGRVNFEGGEVRFDHPKPQGNAVLSSAVHSNAYAFVGPKTTVSENEPVKGFLI